MCRFWEHIEFSLLDGWNLALCPMLTIIFIIVSRRASNTMPILSVHCVSNGAESRVFVFAYYCCVSTPRVRRLYQMANTQYFMWSTFMPPKNRNKCLSSGCETDTLKRRMGKMRRETTESLSFRLNHSIDVFRLHVQCDSSILRNRSVSTGQVFSSSKSTENADLNSSFYRSFVVRLVFMIKSVHKHVPAVNHS